MNRQSKRSRLSFLKITLMAKLKPAKNTSFVFWFLDETSSRESYKYMAAPNFKTLLWNNRACSYCPQQLPLWLVLSSFIKEGISIILGDWYQRICSPSLPVPLTCSVTLGMLSHPPVPLFPLLPIAEMFSLVQDLSLCVCAVSSTMVLQSLKGPLSATVMQTTQIISK